MFVQSRDIQYKDRIEQSLKCPKINILQVIFRPCDRIKVFFESTEHMLYIIDIYLH